MRYEVQVTRLAGTVELPVSSLPAGIITAGYMNALQFLQNHIKEK